MSFPRHDEIYRSDGGGAVRQGSALASLRVGPLSGWNRIAVALSGRRENANGERSADRVPRSSSATSLGSAIPWRVALQQGPPPLHRPISMLHQTAETVNHHPTGGGIFDRRFGEFSTGVDRGAPWLPAGYSSTVISPPPSTRLRHSAATLSGRLSSTTCAVWKMSDLGWVDQAPLLTNSRESGQRP